MYIVSPVLKLTGSCEKSKFKILLVKWWKQQGCKCYLLKRQQTESFCFHPLKLYIHLNITPPESVTTKAKPNETNITNEKHGYIEINIC